MTKVLSFQNKIQMRHTEGVVIIFTTQNTFVDLINDFNERYHGRALPQDESLYLRELVYPKAVPSWLQYEGDESQPLFTKVGTPFCSGYSRVIISDYGPYIEIPQSLIDKSIVKRDLATETNIDMGTSSTRVWFYASDNSRMPLFMQAKTTNLGDFIPEYFYVVPSDVCVPSKFEIEGNFFEAKEDFLCQQVNCKGEYKGGITAKIEEKWPGVKAAYTEYCASSDQLSLLGSYQILPISETQSIINIFSQAGYGRNKDTVYTNYNKLAQALNELAEEYPDKSFAFPMGFGCGSANGDWDTIVNIISCCLREMPVYIYKTTSEIKVDFSDTTESKPEIDLGVEGVEESSTETKSQPIDDETAPPTLSHDPAAQTQNFVLCDENGQPWYPHQPHPNASYSQQQPLYQQCPSYPYATPFANGYSMPAQSFPPPAQGAGMPYQQVQFQTYQQVTFQQGPSPMTPPHGPFNINVQVPQEYPNKTSNLDENSVIEKRLSKLEKQHKTAEEKAAKKRAKQQKKEEPSKPQPIRSFSTKG